MLINIRKRYQQSSKRLFLLDYDGTLAGFQPRPELAQPTTRVLDVLRSMGNDPANTVVIISGRDTQTLEAWLGSLRLTLIAEHGSFVKLPGSGWGQAAAYADEWKADIRRSLQQSVDAMPGSFIEEKATALVWHYRNANAQLSGREALHLIDRLSKLAAEYNIQIVPGNTIVEVREAGVDKGQAATHLLGQDNWDFVFAAGDDTTDEDMFKALPNATTVKVGSGDTQAKNRVRNPDELLGLLEGLA